MKQVIIIRKDLKCRKGKMIVQGCHASIGAMLLASKSTIEKWNNSGNKKICVSVDSLDELLKIKNKANELDIINYLVIDSGLTEFHGEPTETALAIGPCDDDVVNKITGSLSLL